MTTNVVFDTHTCVKDLTEAGLALPIAEVITYEYVSLAAGTFEKAGCVKRLTEAGLALPIAEVIADRYARILEYNRATQQVTAALYGDRVDPPEAHAPRGTNTADRFLKFSIWFAGVAMIFFVSVVVLIKFF